MTHLPAAGPETVESEAAAFQVVQVTPEGRQERTDLVAREFPLTIILDDVELVTLLCTPSRMQQLAIGFLASEGLIERRADIKKVLVDEARGVARVETAGQRALEPGQMFKRFIASGCGRGVAFHSAGAQGYVRVESDMRVSASDISALAADFQHASPVFRATGGVHSAALCEGGKALLFADDIGRHNAVDKVFGEAILQGVETRDHVLITSGRISSEILLKVARRGVPVLVSRSAPTDQAVNVARDLGITLVGFVRGKRMNIYSEDRRVSG